MKRISEFFIGVVLLSLSYQTLAQHTIDTVSIPEVDVSVSRLMKSTVTYDSLLIQSGSKSVGDILLENSNVQIQQYGGRGSIQSLSIRGFSTSQNQVNWNGLAINSLTLGMLNLGGISSGSFDQMSLITGSASSEYGSGAVGGVLTLGNKAKWNKGLLLSVGTEQGSFGANMERYHIDYSNQKWNYSLLYTNEFVKNDYQFINLKKIGKPTETQKHAEFWNTNLVQEIHYKQGKHRIDLVTWLNGKKKNNPKLLTDGSASEQSTADSTIRQVLTYTGDFKKSKLTVLYGSIGERFRYWDYKTDIFTNYWINQQVGEIKYKYYFNNLSSELKLKGEFQKVDNSKFDGEPSRNLTMLSTVNKYQIHKQFSIAGVVGVQTSDEPRNQTPFGSFGYKWTMLQERLLFKWNIASHYRLPSFNDLFWGSGGNPNLKAEQGWSMEQIYQLKSNKNEHCFVQLDLYYSKIDDWIQWIPNGVIWQPENVKSVESYGVDVSEQYVFKWNKVNIKSKSSVSITNTTVVESNESDDPALGNQAIYIPKFNANCGFDLNWKATTLSYQILYKGKRYTTFDNSEKNALPSYFLNQVNFHRTSKYKQFSLFSKIEIQNIFNQSYQVMSNYAMPGRAFYLTLILHFNSIKPGKH